MVFPSLKLEMTFVICGKFSDYYTEIVEPSFDSTRTGNGNWRISPIAQHGKLPASRSRKQHDFLITHYVSKTYIQLEKAYLSFQIADIGKWLFLY
jgi:hypothetical protein